MVTCCANPLEAVSQGYAVTCLTSKACFGNPAHRCCVAVPILEDAWLDVSHSKWQSLLGTHYWRGSGLQPHRAHCWGGCPPMADTTPNAVGNPRHHVGFLGLAFRLPMLNPDALFLPVFQGIVSSQLTQSLNCASQAFADCEKLASPAEAVCAFCVKYNLK